jgi:hypothetical protein
MWTKVEGTFSRKHSEVKAILHQHFGPQHLQETTINGSIKDNHGNWEFPYNGVVSFRYKKDATWFLLLAGHLKDTPRENWRAQYTGTYP